MAIRFQTFVEFVRAFGVRWFVAMSILLGVPLTFESYFVPGSAAKFLLFCCRVGCLVFASFWIWNVERQARFKAEAIVLHPFIDIDHSFLCFESSSGHEVWKANIIPVKSVANVRVCLDVSAHSGGIYEFWNTTRRLVLRRDDFVTGAAVSMSLMELDNGSKGRVWRWATNEGERPSVSLTSHRCQLVFVIDQGPYDYFDFVVTFHYKPPPLRDAKTPIPYEQTPSLMGEHMFLYSRNWKKDGVLK